MLGEVLSIGDQCSIKIPKENREWGYNPCPDGTIVTVTSFIDSYYGRTGNFGREPGVYQNGCWVNVSNGQKEWCENTGRLTLVDEEEYKHRVADWRVSPEKYRVKLRDLPATAFWEGDFITCSAIKVFNWGKLYIQGIDYQNIGNFCADGVTPMPIYMVSGIGVGGYTHVGENECSLIERGNVWKYYHNEVINFASLAEEASFFDLLGHTYEVRNPANKLYSWTKDEVLEAIRQGIAHGFSVSNGLFGSGPRPTAIRFKNEELGKRVAEATLRGFSSCNMR